MSYKIVASCISCGACESECKNGAIGEGGSTYVIDPKKCTECVGVAKDPKCIDLCPLDDCIVPDPAHKEEKAQLLEKWKKLHPGEQPAAGTF